MDKEISLTPTSAIRDMTKALPDIPNGACPIIYEQVIEAPVGAQSGQPDPAHYD